MITPDGNPNPKESGQSEREKSHRATPVTTSHTYTRCPKG